MVVLPVSGTQIPPHRVPDVEMMRAQRPTDPVLPPGGDVRVAAEERMKFLRLIGGR